jgi:hypothetical protein
MVNLWLIYYNIAHFMITALLRYQTSKIVGLLKNNPSNRLFAFSTSNSPNSNIKIWGK